MPRRVRTAEEKQRENDQQKARRALKRKLAEEDHSTPEYYRTKVSLLPVEEERAQTLVVKTYATPQEIIRLARLEQAVPYKYISHEIVLTTSAFLYLADNHTILGLCTCQFTSKCQASQVFGHHFHVLLYHPGHSNDSISRKMNLLLYKREPYQEVTGQFVKKPVHKRSISIRCEFHLLYVMHYISCVTASKRSALYEKGTHGHIFLNGPLKGHIHHLKRNKMIANRKECDSTKRHWEKELAITHNYDTCTCIRGKKFMEKQLEYEKMSTEERVNKMLAKLIRLNMVNANDLANGVEIGSEPSMEQLRTRAENIIRQISTRNANDGYAEYSALLEGEVEAEAGEPSNLMLPLENFLLIE